MWCVVMSHCPFSRLNHGIAGSVFLKQELVNIANCQQVGPKRVFATRRHSPSPMRIAALTGPWTCGLDTLLGV